MASGEESSPLCAKVVENSSKSGTRQRILNRVIDKTCQRIKIWWMCLSSIIRVLLLLQLAGVYPLLVYCARTYYSGINEKHPHYHCEKSPDVIGLGQNAAMILELTFALSVMVSCVIFVGLGVKLLLKRGQIWSSFWKPLLTMSETWLLIGTWGSL